MGERNFPYSRELGIYTLLTDHTPPVTRMSNSFYSALYCTRYLKHVICCLIMLTRVMCQHIAHVSDTPVALLYLLV